MVSRAGFLKRNKMDEFLPNLSRKSGKVRKVRFLPDLSRKRRKGPKWMKRNKRGKIATDITEIHTKKIIREHYSYMTSKLERSKTVTICR